MPTSIVGKKSVNYEVMTFCGLFEVINKICMCGGLTKLAPVNTF